MVTATSAERGSPSRAHAVLKIGLLGPLQLVRDGRHLAVMGPKQRALLTLLALHAGTPVDREGIVEALWPTDRNGREAATLRVHISHLRKVVELHRGAAPEVIVTVGSGYMVSSEHADVDIVLFHRLASAARQVLTSDPEVALEHLNDALVLWRGRPLQDVTYEEFAQDELRRLDLARLGVVTDRAEVLSTLGRDAAALDDLEALVRGDPTQERPVALLMRGLYRTGRQTEALHVARRHARHLRERGLEPSPRVQDLERRILRHDPALLPVDGDASSDIGPGHHVRGYELREVVGAGPVGTVHRAYQASVGRPVAVKSIHAELAQRPDFVRRFADEAQTLAALEHPHLVPLYDFWREPAGAFLVFRWVDGGNLVPRLSRPWEPEDLRRVFAPLAGALAYAHAGGMNHGNLGPTNVLFDATGNAYLTDLSHPGCVAPSSHLDGEGPAEAADVLALGTLLRRAATGDGLVPHPPLPAGLAEVIEIATAPEPADRYPDGRALETGLLEAVGARRGPVPRRVRRNPYKGLASFETSDRADFCGRDDVTESLLGLVASKGLTAVLGASGSGKSSLVLAGLVPQLRAGALPGAEGWNIVTMVPGTDPFEELDACVRDVSVAPVGRGTGRPALRERLTGPTGRALLVIDQFEELYSSQVDDDTREWFLRELVILATDPSHGVRIVVTVRADLSDGPLLHPEIGDLLAAGSLLLGPMRPEQLEEAIRRPAARAGVEVEPALVTALVGDVSSAPASLPLLQYALTELFERRSEDRLTVAAYRALGGVQGVLERRADATYASLSRGAKESCRQLFLRMVHLGDHGEETRRRLPITELQGLGRRADVDEALAAFAGARLLTYDRDPVTRTPTVEVAHETVIRRWARYRVWIDEAQSTLSAQRRLSAAARTWVETDEAPSYLLTGGPLVTALDVAADPRTSLNALEARFLSESACADEASKARESELRRRQAALSRLAERRLRAVITAAAVVAVIALVAGVAVVERDRANELAATQERHSLARELAAASGVNLTSSDPELSILLALEAADLSLGADEEILPEVVDALHRAVIQPRAFEVSDEARGEHGGQSLSYAANGTWLAVLSGEGGVLVLDPLEGRELGRIPPAREPAVGLDTHPRDGRSILVRYRDRVRAWDWRTGQAGPPLAVAPEGAAITTAVYSPDGDSIVVGRDDGAIEVWRSDGSKEVELHGHDGPVVSVDVAPSGDRLVSGGTDRRVLVWDIRSRSVAAEANTDRIVLSISQVAWHPVEDVVAVVTHQGDNLLLDAGTGERLNSFGNSQHRSHAVAFDSSGAILITADADGFVRVYGTWVGGEALVVTPTGGAPLRDAAIDPIGGGAAAVSVDGHVRLSPAPHGSELPDRTSHNLYPTMVASADGSRYVTTAHGLKHGIVGAVPTGEVVDAATGRSLLQRPTVSDWGTRTPAITADGSSVAFAGPTGDVQIVEVDTDTTRTIPESAVHAASLAFSHDRTLLAGGGIEGTIEIWDVATLSSVASLKGHGDRRPRLGSALLDADGSDPGSGPDAATGLGSPAYALDGATNRRVNQVAFHPDGARLFSAGFDGTVRSWTLTEGRGRVLRSLDHAVFSVALTPDGTALAAADRAGTILLLDVDTGDLLSTPEPAPGPTNLTISPDGATMAAAVFHPVAYVWDLGTGRVQRRIHGSIFRLTSVAFVNGGAELRTASGEAIDRGYVLDPTRLAEIAREQVSRRLHDAECRTYLRGPCRD
ncbi:BTAD domain-containing putative transcriptional regulator [Nitriliruptor alkaliphilus]|uniref:nSTAND1 domain-containing NTPase n=1 Tax=Nitriliruptor alkaliphilus TaxID=427918 RepID=UPI0006991C49|nr:BTAD domain-containing putative transcriptional regulator [Nitriliruptor alkaliphilus]